MSDRNDTPSRWDVDGSSPTVADQFARHISWLREEDGSSLALLIARKVEALRDEFAALGATTVWEYSREKADVVMRASAAYAHRVEDARFDEGLGLHVYLLDDGTEVAVTDDGRIRTSEELGPPGGP